MPRSVRRSAAVEGNYEYWPGRGQAEAPVYAIGFKSNFPGFLVEIIDEFRQMDPVWIVWSGPIDSEAIVDAIWELLDEWRSRTDDLEIARLQAQPLSELVRRADVPGLTFVRSPDSSPSFVQVRLGQLETIDLSPSDRLVREGDRLMRAGFDDDFFVVGSRVHGHERPGDQHGHAQLALDPLPRGPFVAQNGRREGGRTVLLRGMSFLDMGAYPSYDNEPVFVADGVSDLVDELVRLAAIGAREDRLQLDPRSADDESDEDERPGMLVHRLVREIDRERLGAHGLVPLRAAYSGVPRRLRPTQDLTRSLALIATRKCLSQPSRTILSGIGRAIPGVDDGGVGGSRVTGASGTRGQSAPACGHLGNLDRW